MNTGKIMYVTIACILAIISKSYSQPAWVKDVIIKTKNMTVHKDAAAIVLHDVTEIEISNKGNAKTKIQLAYKILSSDGEKYGFISVPIYPFLKVKNLQGWIISRDNSSKTLPKENILTMSADESAGYYNDSHILIASLPDVEPGVIVAFELATEEKGWTSLYQSFIFQKQQPTGDLFFIISLKRISCGTTLVVVHL